MLIKKEYNEYNERERSYTTVSSCNIFRLCAETLLPCIERKIDFTSPVPLRTCLFLSPSSSALQSPPHSAHDCSAELQITTVRVKWEPAIDYSTASGGPPEEIQTRKLCQDHRRKKALEIRPWPRDCALFALHIWQSALTRHTTSLMHLHAVNIQAQKTRHNVNLPGNMAQEK